MNVSPTIKSTKAEQRQMRMTYV